jgi:hypothetical protein
VCVCLCVCVCVCFIMISCRVLVMSIRGSSNGRIGDMEYKTHKLKVIGECHNPFF